MSWSYIVWYATMVADAVALVASLRPGLDKGLGLLRWYFLLLVFGNVSTFSAFLTYGFRSSQYAYLYFLTDLADVIFGYLVLARLVELVFEKSSLKLPGLRAGAIIVFTGLAACSAAVVYLSRGSLSIPAVSMAMEQNFSFLGMILAILLFMGINVMQVPGVRFRRIVLAFSVLYSAGAISYALSVVIPEWLHAVGHYLVPLAGFAGAALMAWALWSPEPRRARVPAMALPAAAR